MTGPGAGATIVSHNPIASPPQYASYPQTLSEEIRTHLTTHGVPSLYTHQAEMFTLATRGKNIVNTTSTASGKTLGFLLPVVQEILSNPQSRAIFLYPTKALASDQYRAIRPWIETFGEHRLSAGVYDGDTPPTERSRISCQCVPPPFQNLQILSRITQVPLQFRYHSKPRGTCPGSVPERIHPD